MSLSDNLRRIARERVPSNRARKLHGTRQSRPHSLFPGLENLGKRCRLSRIRFILIARSNRQGTRFRAIRLQPANGEICCIQVAMNYPRDFSEVCAISSVVERLLHTQEVAGSNPASRTSAPSAEKTLNDLKWRKIAAVVVIIITKIRLGKSVAGFITIMCRVQDPHNSKSSRRNPIKERAGKSLDTSMESPRFLGIQRKRKPVKPARNLTFSLPLTVLILSCPRLNGQTLPMPWRCLLRTKPA